MAFSRNIRTGCTSLIGLGPSIGPIELTLGLFTFLMALFILGALATNMKIEGERNIRAFY